MVVSGGLPRADFPSLSPNQNTRIVFHLRNCTWADLIAQKRRKRVFSGQYRAGVDFIINLHVLQLEGGKMEIWLATLVTQRRGHNSLELDMIGRSTQLIRYVQCHYSALLNYASCLQFTDLLVRIIACICFGFVHCDWQWLIVSDCDSVQESRVTH